MTGDGPGRDNQLREGIRDVAALLATVSDMVSDLERVADPEARRPEPRRARAARAAAEQEAGQARARSEVFAAELAAARHERDAALAEADRQAQAAAAAARDRDQFWQSARAQIAVFEDALAGLRMLAEHAEVDHTRILGERDLAAAELGRVRAAAVTALAACERSLGGAGPAPVEEAAAVLRAVTGAPPGQPGRSFRPAPRPGDPHAALSETPEAPGAPEAGRREG